ncbi:MAG: hypothetical protein P8Z41_09565 [Anaerolineales bacterium]
MFTVFRYTLRRYRGQIIGWGIGLGLTGVLLVSMFDSIGTQTEALNEYLSVFPEEFIAFFGDFADFGSPQGFLGVEFFSARRSSRDVFWPLSSLRWSFLGLPGSVWRCP